MLSASATKANWESPNVDTGIVLSMRNSTIKLTKISPDAALIATESPCTLMTLKYRGNFTSQKQSNGNLAVIILGPITKKMQQPSNCLKASRLRDLKFYFILAMSMLRCPTSRLKNI
jgi:hypothetical protein